MSKSEIRVGDFVEVTHDKRQGKVVEVDLDAEGRAVPGGSAKVRFPCTNNAFDDQWLALTNLTKLPECESDRFSLSNLVKKVAERAEQAVDHPAHYGGGDNLYEAIKVIEAWGLGFCLGNAVKYICRHKHKGSPLEDLKKARWYLDREITRLEREQKR